MPKIYNTAFGQFYGNLKYGEAAQLARDAGISPQYLWAIASGGRLPGRLTCKKLIQADDRITIGMLWPNDFED